MLTYIITLGEFHGSREIGRATDLNAAIKLVRHAQLEHGEQCKCGGPGAEILEDDGRRYPAQADPAFYCAVNGYTD